jgi:hypothetical protein
MRGIAWASHAGSASDYESEGRTFESFRARQQPIEQKRIFLIQKRIASTTAACGSNMEARRRFPHGFHDYFSANLSLGSSEFTASRYAE